MDIGEYVIPRTKGLDYWFMCVVVKVFYFGNVFYREIVGLMDDEKLSFVLENNRMSIYDCDFSDLKVKRISNCFDYDFTFLEYFLSSNLSLFKKLKFLDNEKIEIFNRVVNAIKKGESDIEVYTDLLTNDAGIRYSKVCIHFEYLHNRLKNLILIITDINEILRQQTPETVKRKKAFLNGDEKISEYVTNSEFFSKISHDIKTPLNGIMGMAQIALSQEMDEQKDRCIEKVIEVGNCIVKLLDDALEVNSIEKGQTNLKKEEYSLNQLYSYIRKTVGISLVNKNIDFEIQDNDPELLMNVDRTRFNMLFKNLMGHISDFCKEGSNITIKRTENTNKNGCVYLNLDLICSDLDVDCDFDSGFLESMERACYKNDCEDQGNILDLVLAKKLLRLLNGEIKLNKSKDTVKRISISLPVDLEDTSKDLYVDSWKDYFSGQHFLVCEDNEINSEIMEIFLKENGIEVDIAKNGVEAIEKFTNSSPYFYDTILMDIRMPKMDGLEAAKRIRSSERGDAKMVPIIAMTANSFDGDIEMSKYAGMNAHLSKPVDFKKLFKTIKNIV
ncbi:CheY chemotaxis protein or a CheY-like REC (receiver) domain [Acetitomaculum ruminis DSM 5522]|uniref:Stage 0 sporulation protein A homolog n=1 Tax=Acetitomaculum ruminis DSM 5522 TaxID=1120918 RepID=A0A1I0V2X9_9FIRM|nr:hybrid sensor histidine kinase/response regulator [Acetitomaculum ruminis]SFA70602.1 CheY chemotaxis protein or a CheY-like REC (receiver) domain [Acetitomaculum ruminis DSM 5522]